MPDIDVLRDHILQLLFEDEIFSQTFCRDCPSISCEDECPVDYDMTYRHCCRCYDWRDIEDLVDEIAQIAIPLDWSEI